MKENTALLAPLFTLLNEIKPMCTELREAIMNSFEYVEIKKGDVLLAEGHICTNLWFLVNGLLRSFHEMGEKEITSRIMFTNHIVISPGSFFTQTPATESIEALCNSEVATIPFRSLQKIYESFPEFNLHTRIITEQYFYKQEQRLYMLRKHGAKEKYNFFLDNYADYLKDIPQKYIASFLNIAPETLSRTRSKLSKKRE